VLGDPPVSATGRKSADKKQRSDPSGAFVAVVATKNSW